MKEDFHSIKNHRELASFFDLTYSELSETLYKTDDFYKYIEFYIPKKGGGSRKINSPRSKIKSIQKKLSDVLYEIYPVRPAAFGFVKGKNIVQNAEKHLDKNFVFNIDLSDFFGCIHFGRVRNLFQSAPFNFNHSVSTILAQICCFNNSLPQGAPSSPILSNMVAWKLDAQLQQLAKVTRSTYTRYADDITYSFTCSKRRLPEEIVIIRDSVASPGHALSHIIEENGFDINYKKVRLAGTTQRMEVTGIKVNEFPNVSRQYIRKISSILHSWRKYGYEATENEFNEKNLKKRATDVPKSLKHVIKGKLSFLRSVRGARDVIFNKLASQYNDLVDVEDLKFKIFIKTEAESNAIDSLWVIESCYNDDVGNLVAEQGTGFLLDNYGLITCAHVVSKNNEVFCKIDVYKNTDPSKVYSVKVLYLDKNRDVAICEIIGLDDQDENSVSINISDTTIEQGLKAILLGFPNYSPGKSHYIANVKIAAKYPLHGVNMFEIDSQIRDGNSGGPVIDMSGKLLGVVLMGASGKSGNNAVLYSSELEYVKNSEYLL